MLPPLPHQVQWCYETEEVLQTLSARARFGPRDGQAHIHVERCHCVSHLPRPGS